MSTLTELESAVLAMLLEGAGPALEHLRSQLPRLEVRSREWTGVGFLTELDATRCGNEGGGMTLEGTIGDLLAETPGLGEGIGFLVYIEQGRVAALEGHTCGASWPDVVPVSSLRYVDPTERDLSQLTGGAGSSRG